MLIARFGDTWAGAYELPQLKAIDEWRAERPVVAEQVSGASGVFEYYDDDNFPVAPLNLSKKLTLKGTSYSNVETLLNTMRDATIAADKTKLWGLLRDGTTHVWTWAKCVGFRGPEVYNRGQFLHMDVDLAFYGKSGLWYSETKAGNTITCEFDEASDTGTPPNNGNVPALVKFTVTPDTVTMTSAAANIANQCTWQFDANVLATKDLVVDGELYSCTNDGADAYTDLTLGSSSLIGSAATPQVAWFWLVPGSNTVTVKRAPFPAGGEVDFVLEWWHTYVF